MNNSQGIRFGWLGGAPKPGRVTRAGFVSIVLGMVLAISMAAPVHAQDAAGDADPFARFGNYTEESDLSIDHGAWNSLLGSTVVVIEASNRVMAGSRSRPRTGTKISRGSGTAARRESNRVLFHLLEKEHEEQISKYRRELERLPKFYPLADFDKDEQLAYWLNLHNVTLYEQLAQRYPVAKLKTLRNGRRNQPSLWDEKLLTVEGVALSLRDIQDNILIRHWKSPMVLYGLYQGAIGGPSLPNRAFTAENVHAVLRSAASEFVNSNRGFKMWSGKARVSQTYEWGAAAFPDWENDIVSHLTEFAKSSRKASLAKATGVKANLYDWGIADTKGGTLSAGPAHSTAAGFLSMKGGGIPIKGGINTLRGLNTSGQTVPGALDPETIAPAAEGPEKDQESDEESATGTGGEN